MNMTHRCHPALLRASLRLRGEPAHVSPEVARLRAQVAALTAENERLTASLEYHRRHDREPLREVDRTMPARRVVDAEADPRVRVIDTRRPVGRLRG